MKCNILSSYFKCISLPFFNFTFPCKIIQLSASLSTFDFLWYNLIIRHRKIIHVLTYSLISLNEEQRFIYVQILKISTAHVSPIFMIILKKSRFLQRKYLPINSAIWLHIQSDANNFSFNIQIWNSNRKFKKIKTWNNSF